MTEKPIKKMLSAAKIVQGERNKVYFNYRAAAYLLQISLKYW